MLKELYESLTAFQVNKGKEREEKTSFTSLFPRSTFPHLGYKKAKFPLDRSWQPCAQSVSHFP